MVPTRTVEACQSGGFGDVLRRMTSLDQWERRFGWLSFPGFLRYYAILHVLVFVLQIFRPGIGSMMDFDLAKILSGEVWRLATCFFAASQFGTLSPLSLVFLLCAVNFMFMVSDGLEAEWGSFRTSIFCYTGMLSILAAHFILPFTPPLGGLVLYGTAFLAFATLFPKVEILLFFILPVRVGLLGIVQVAAMLVGCLGAPWLFPFYLIAFINYFIWAGIPALRGTKRAVDSARRRRRFNAAKQPADEAFHTCETCGRTDASDPSLEFRVGGDGREYCEEHLPR